MNSRGLKLICFLLLTTGLVLRAELLVSSFLNNRVFRFNETNGALLDQFIPNTNGPPGQLSLPHGLAFGPDGNLYVASAGNDSVLRFNGTNGLFLSTFVTNASGGLDYPVALIFRGDGLLYVSSQSNDNGLRFSATKRALVDPLRGRA